MLSKSKIRLIKALSRKKQRNKHGLFVVEGLKNINELLSSSLELEELYTTKPIFDGPANKLVEVSEKELKKISALTTPQTALAVFKIPPQHLPSSDFILALDSVRDPGNLGTLIRLCDWFGVYDIICSTDCVDCYNPKTIQATMGSIARITLFYTDLNEFISESELPVYGAFMEGKNVYSEPLRKKGILVLGNEANGISPEIEKHVDEKLSIPQFGKNNNTESLNVAMAGSVFLSEFSRRNPAE